MYLPPQFREDDPGALHDLIRSFALGLLARDAPQHEAHLGRSST